ncbi:uncharacterized protein LOC124260319 isoform X2 [Haliotis rubra]|uniref:uncharacterized protein LOC124260319 isoform X2 n=1 Tax=Haliotis rubra TaxID=36100 RepID=UPI001EE52B3C|nr:uncharacterized protein LOC124260319 isoform X2 [Haliotis rubra]
MSFVVMQRCPDCGGTFKDISNNRICHSRGSGKHASKPSVVLKQVCLDCGRDFLNLANHKVCHGRGAGNRRTSYPLEAVPWLAPTQTYIDYVQGNADSTPRPPRDSGHGQTNHQDTPPPTPPSSNTERRTPAQQSQVKKKAIDVRRESCKTGGGPAPVGQSDLEHKVVSMIPQRQIEGITGGLESEVEEKREAQPGVTAILASEKERTGILKVLLDVQREILAVSKQRLQVETDRLALEREKFEFKKSVINLP